MEAIVVHEGERPGKREFSGFPCAAKRVYQLINCKVLKM
jgi:hypothetical protein